jgi:peptide/nickel transport system substrate-binding protein
MAANRYKFVEWVAGDSITLERYDDYWGNEAYFEKIIFRFITDDNTRALALETGEIDIAQSIPASQVSYLESTGLVDLEIYPSLSIDYIGFNCQKEPFNDVRIRQALRYAIDLESMVDIAYGVGVTAEAADGICTPSFCDYIPASEELTYHYDPEKAKELLAEAGYPDGFSCQVMVVGQQDRVDMVEMLQNAWAEIGVNIEPYVTEIGTYYDIIASGDYDMFYGGWVILANDGDLMHDTFYSDPELWYTTNYTAYVNPEFDELVDAARVELDTEKRSALYGDVQNLIRSELPFIACTYNNKVDGIRSTLQGYPHDPSGYPCLSGVAPKA